MELRFVLGLISIAIGIFAILQGMGKIKISQDPETQAELVRDQGKFRIALGVVITIGGLLRVFGVF